MAPANFTPDATFGFNVQAFTHYLAKAVEVGAPMAAVQAAWDEFLLAFPPKVAARTLDWPDLLSAARVFYATIGGRSVGEVAAALHADVREHAAPWARR